MTDDAPDRPPDAVPGGSAQPSNQPLDESAVTEPLDDGEGGTYQVEQQNVGTDNERGSGEWPSPSTPPTGPSPGTADPSAGDDRDGPTLSVYEQDPDLAGSGSTAQGDDDDDRAGDVTH